MQYLFLEGTNRTKWFVNMTFTSGFYFSHLTSENKFGQILHRFTRLDLALESYQDRRITIKNWRSIKILVLVITTETTVLSLMDRIRFWPKQEVKIKYHEFKMKRGEQSLKGTFQRNENKAILSAPVVHFFLGASKFWGFLLPTIKDSTTSETKCVKSG